MKTIKVTSFKVNAGMGTRTDFKDGDILVWIDSPQLCGPLKSIGKDENGNPVLMLCNSDDSMSDWNLEALVDCCTEDDLYCIRYELVETLPDIWGQDMSRDPVTQNFMCLRSMWRLEVADGSTQLGYWDWVDHKKEETKS